MYDDICIMGAASCSPEADSDTTIEEGERQVKVLIKNLDIFFLCPSKQFLPISFQIQLLDYFPKNRRNKDISS
jgi:hypothetical protein